MKSTMQTTPLLISTLMRYGTTVHGGSEVVLVDNTLAEPFSRLLPHLPGVRHVIVNGSVDDETRAALAEPDHVEAVHDFAGLIAGEPGTFDWRDAQAEDDAASMCYTSGTK